jgi:hypothetical protein
LKQYWLAPLIGQPRELMLQNAGFDIFAAVIVDDRVAKDTVEPGRGGIVRAKRVLLINCLGVCRLKDIFCDCLILLTTNCKNRLRRPMSSEITSDVMHLFDVLKGLNGSSAASP